MSKLTESARGQDCQIRIPGVCNFDPETTVLAHLPGGGMGKKQPDWMGAFACSACHDAIDGRTRPPGRWTRHGADLDYYRIAHYEGVIRTQAIWFEMGLLEVK